MRHKDKSVQKPQPCDTGGSCSLITICRWWPAQWAASWLEASGSHFLDMKSDCISAKKKNPLDWWYNTHGIYYTYGHFHKRIFQRYFRRLFCCCCCFSEGWNDRGNFPSLTTFGSMLTSFRFCNGPETKGLKQKSAFFFLSVEVEDSTSVGSDKKWCR